jgi:hypothetical protein
MALYIKYPKHITISLQWFTTKPKHIAKIIHTLVNKYSYQTKIFNCYLMRINTAPCAVSVKSNATVLETSVRHTDRTLLTSTESERPYHSEGEVTGLAAGLIALVNRTVCSFRQESKNNSLVVHPAQHGHCTDGAINCDVS